MIFNDEVIYPFIKALYEISLMVTLYVITIATIAHNVFGVYNDALYFVLSQWFGWSFMDTIRIVFISYFVIKPTPITYWIIGGLTIYTLMNTVYGVSLFMSVDAQYKSVYNTAEPIILTLLSVVFTWQYIKAHLYWWRSIEEGLNHISKWIK